MNLVVRKSSISLMLNMVKKKKEGTLERYEVENLLEHKDYKMELERYAGRITKEAFIDYFMCLPNLKEEDIENSDLKAHHQYYIDLFQNLDVYVNHQSKLQQFDEELLTNQVKIALNGLPEGFEFDELHFVISIGIGQSFGYVHQNNMHFDYLQLVKNYDIGEFLAVIAHEIHHVGMDKLYSRLNLDDLPLEELFYLYFSGEGLAVKYCNNAEGVLSRCINLDKPKNHGLDAFTWDYLNADFEDTMSRFLQTIRDIKGGKIATKEDLNEELAYWMSPYTKEQSKDAKPELLHFRLYSFGNEIWGIIHDCFGKEKVYETLANPKKFPFVYNQAMDVLGHKAYKIPQDVI